MCSFTFAKLGTGCSKHNTLVPVGINTTYVAHCPKAEREKINFKKHSSIRVLTCLLTYLFT